jgi:hypothetical protein
MDEQPFAQIPENIEIKSISTGGGGNSLTAKNVNGKIETTKTELGNIFFTQSEITLIMII